MDLAVDPVLAHPAGDELGELAAEVEDEDGLVAGDGDRIGSGMSMGLSPEVPHSSVSDFSSRVISSSRARLRVLAVVHDGHHLLGDRHLDALRWAARRAMATELRIPSATMWVCCQ